MIRVRCDTPMTSGCATRAYLLTSQNTFCQSISVVVSVSDNDGRQAVGVRVELADLESRRAVPASADEIGYRPAGAEVR